MEVDTLTELEQLEQQLNQLYREGRSTNDRDIRRLKYNIGRLKTLNLIKNVENIDVIVQKTIRPDIPPANVTAKVESDIDKVYTPNTLLIDACKIIIDGEFPPPPPVQPVLPGEPYQGYLNTFNGHRIFTLKSEIFVSDNLQPILYDIGAYNSRVPYPLYDQYKKYYNQGDFDTISLFMAIFYKNSSIQPNSQIDLLTSSYTHDPDPDDLYDEAENDIFRIFTVYGIVKRITAFIKSGNLDASMRYLRALKDWIVEENSRADEPRISQLLLKRIGIMTELLWYVLSRWPVIIPDPVQDMVGPYNVKLYAGIGTQTSDANYEVFVAGLFNNIAQHTPPQCFHNQQAPEYPVLNQDGTNRQIISRDFVSTAYSFDAASKFCKILGCGQQGVTNIFCMLEFILEPGKQLPFIGSSANEAEVLLKPGNVYQFIKRYRVKYTRLLRGNDEPMIIYIYQFLLINDRNDILPVKDFVSTKQKIKKQKGLGVFNFNNHSNWSVTVNDFITEFSRLAGISNTYIASQEVTEHNDKKRRNDGNDDDDDEIAGGSSKRKRQTKRRRQTNKKLRMKKYDKKRKTNKRRCKKSRRI
jgi:hypothetical protein